MSLTPAQAARQLLEANLVNLGNKVYKDKKALSPSELALLQNIAEGSEGSSLVWAQDQVKLAAALGVTRQTIQRWLKLDGNPGAKPNGRYSVVEWREWMKATHKRPAEEKDLEALRLESQRLANEHVRTKLGILRKAFMPVADVERWGSELGADVSKILDQIPRSAPQLEGLNAVELEKRLQELVDEAKGCFQLLGERVEKVKEEAALAAAMESGEEG